MIEWFLSKLFIDIFNHFQFFSHLFSRFFDEKILRLFEENLIKLIKEELRILHIFQ